MRMWGQVWYLPSGLQSAKFGQHEFHPQVSVSRRGAETKMMRSLAGMNVKLVTSSISNGASSILCAIMVPV